MIATNFAGRVAVLTSTILAGVAGILTAVWWTTREANKFRNVAYIKKIMIYPVKSLPGIEVPYAKCQIEGLTYETLRDRSLMIVRGDYFVSQREAPSLARIKVSYKDGKLQLQADGMPSLSFDASDPDMRSKQHKTVRVRKNAYEAVDVSEEASVWFRDYLKKEDIHLVRILQDTSRMARDDSIPSTFHDHISFHLLSEASVADLNSRMSNESVTERNFRPNFLLQGCEAYAEDYWRCVQLGEAIVEYFDRCGRCILTTVDPDTGIRSDKEPLITLRSYRRDTPEHGTGKYKMDPLFGVLYRLQKEGVAQLGDEVRAVVANKPLL